MNGGSLLALIMNPTFDITPEIALKLVRNIAAGMLHLHSEGIIHRDLAA